MPDQAEAFEAHPMIVPTVKSRSFSTVSPASMLNSLKGPGMTARQSVLAVIEAYRKTFEQQSVLWESARVCVAA
jgi:hypothetical protein